MEANILKIKCPCCGATLAVKNQPDLDKKSITCPNCKMKSKFTNYKQVVSKPVQSANDSDETRYNTGGEETQFSDNSEATSLNLDQNFNFGYFVVQSSRQRLQLKKGRNVIGRKANSSVADLQIDTDSRKVSRQHSVVDVKVVDGKGLLHYFSNAENKNPTYVNDNLVENGDKLILNDGDIVRMADVTLKFCIPDY